MSESAGKHQRGFLPVVMSRVPTLRFPESLPQSFGATFAAESRGSHSKMNALNPINPEPLAISPKPLTKEYLKVDVGFAAASP